MKPISLVVLSSVALLSKICHACIDKATYYAIDSDIEKIASSITSQNELVHFYGGIVRLAAHDFMDHDRNSGTPYGSDGCIEWNHEVNKGLQTIWCNSCPLTKLYKKTYSYISKADFWVISANAVIRQLSKNQSFDLANTFLWGRKDAASCQGAGDRIPTGTGCREVEDTLLDAMGLQWRDAVALLGAHTIGKGHEAFSGHDGYWMPTVADSLVFDKKYYEELILRTWRSRNIGTKEEDFVASTEETHEHPQMMLKADVCLLYNTDRKYPCCSKTNRFLHGVNECDWEEVLSNKKCPSYAKNDSRMEAVRAVLEYLGGISPNDNQGPFYKAYATAWFKATTNGHDNLKSIRRTCW
ncbi:hypothetical protein HJC23_013636 [Cyclotella cryptica]|uniref:Plant heme peroxidase family profile domain-containing protein n=1 Tax=Cyclotella cryptica TaxID=29204 RepID=A0ABD3P8Y0_9STRA|eukprot:CCRYP_016516-RA/>CCRYP_016516-RA protein AED:0.35 eAED:0.35 QI:128/1/1/1/1/1/2/579/354